MVMKNVFVYRSQLPLILAFAVTIHKCQGRSLDNAIIDLSVNVFSEEWNMLLYHEYEHCLVYI